MNSTAYTILAILVCAACTFALRVAPFALFSGKRGMPPVVRRLAMKMPAAIIAVLVVYCLKGITPLHFPYALPELISSAVVVLLHIWKRNTLLSIGGGTACYMLLIQVVFR